MTIIKIKNSNTPNTTPSGLLEGEIAINTADGILFYGDKTQTVKQFTPLNAVKADQLNTERRINGAVFNGTNDIITEFWGAGRTFTVGNTTKVINGSQNVAWTLNEIGAIGTESPSFTGTPTAPTAISGDSTTQIATTKFVNTEILNHTNNPLGHNLASTTAHGFMSISDKIKLDSLVSGGEVFYNYKSQNGKNLWVLRDDQPYQITSQGDAIGIRIIGDTAEYFNMVDEKAEKVTATNIYNQIAPFVTRLIHIVGGGQSLAMGEGTDPLISTKPIAVNRIFSPNYGVRTETDTTVINASDIAPFKPLVGGIFYSEIPSLVATNSLVTNFKAPPDAAFLNSLHAGGARGIAALTKGTIFYENALQAIRGANEYCSNVLGINYELGYVSWIHGETDSNRWPGEYYDGMIVHQENFSTDVASVLGRYADVMFILDQISNWTGSVAYQRAESSVPFEQLQLAIDMPHKFMCAGPKYWIETINDGVHLPARGSYLLGKLHGYVGSKFLSGESWLPVHCKRVERNGHIVKLFFHVPEGGQLVLDEINVTDPGNYGLRWIDDSNSAHITSVEVSSNTITVFLSDNPTGANKKIGIADIGNPGDRAGPTTGPRTCFRSNLPIELEDGTKIYHWACHQLVNVM